MITPRTSGLQASGRDLLDHLQGLRPSDLLLLLSTTSLLALAPWVAGRLISLGIAGGVVLWQLARERDGARWRWPIPSVLLALAAWTAWCCLSTTWSMSPAFSRTEVKADVLYPVTAFLVLHYAAQRLPDPRPWLAAFTITMMTLPIHALIMTALHRWDVYRWQGGPSPFSTLLLLWLTALLPILRLRQVGTLIKVIVWPGLVVLLVFATMSLNRSLWLAFAGAVVVFALAVRGDAPASSHAHVARGHWVLALIAIAGVLVLVGWAKERAIEQPGVPETPLAERMLEDDRLKLWPYAWEQIRHAPWIGHGFGRGILAHDFQEYFADDPNAHLFWHPHNMFASTALQTGAIGLCAQLALLASLIAAFLRMRREPGWVRVLGATGLALVVAAVLKNQTDDTLGRGNAFLFLAMCGALLGAARRADAPTAHATTVDASPPGQLASRHSGA